jgi:DNA-directed RNA polymerase specialized sigma24 family protein
MRSRRFPYRATNPTEADEIRLLINGFLTTLRPEISRMVARYIRVRPNEDHEDVVQDTLLHIFEYTIPRYDLSRRGPGGRPASFKTFLRRAARNYILDQSKRRIRERTRARPAATPAGDLDSLAARGDVQYDRRVVSLAKAVMSHPERYMPPTQVRVFNVWLANDRLSSRDLALLLGYHREDSLHMAMTRIRRSVAKINIYDHADETDRTPADVR